MGNTAGVLSHTGSTVCWLTVPCMGTDLVEHLQRLVAYLFICIQMLQMIQLPYTANTRTHANGHCY